MVLFSNRLSVLIYHRVVPEPNPLFPDEVCAKGFDWQMRLLRRWFNVLPLREAAERLRTGKLPLNAASVTFDDGYADNATIALPILRRHGVSATFFVATGFLDGGRMWNDTATEAVCAARGDVLDAGCVGLEKLDISSIDHRRRAISAILSALKYLPVEERKERVDALAMQTGVALESDLMMSAEQVRTLHANGMEIGAHTISHPILSKLDRKQALNEMAGSKQRLEEISGSPVKLFAYPNGRPGVDYLREHVSMAQELGFEAAVSTAPGVSRPGCDLFQLPRFTPWDKAPGKFLVRLFHNTLRTNPATI